MSIEAIMTSPVVSISMDDPIRLAGEYFSNRGIHHLPVVDEKKRVSGVVSEREYLSVVSPYFNTPSETRRDLEIMGRKVHTIMRRNPTVVTADTHVSEAARLLIENQFSSLLVIDEGSEKLRGIVTWKDLVRALADARIDIQDGEVIKLPEEKPEEEAELAEDDIVIG